MPWPIGHKHTPEARQKMSEALKGRRHSPEHRKHLSEAMTGKPCLWLGEYNKQRNIEDNPMKRPEVAAKVAKSKMGVPRSEETRKKLSETKTGKKMSAEFCAKHSGEHAAGWKGGVSFKPYCHKFNPEFKRRVRAFYNNECVICGKPKTENGRNLHVHHVDYDKQVCCNGNQPRFVILCAHHHSMTNNNREQWQQIFCYIIDNIFNGKTYYTLEEYKCLEAVKG